MSALTITFRQAREAGACTASYRKMAEHLGGVRDYGRDTPIPLTVVFDVLGMDDTLWALRAIGAERVLQLFACECAERVLPIFEGAYPGDLRPRTAIRIARLCAIGMASVSECRAAAAHAYAAHAAAAHAAHADYADYADYAAGAAAAAERAAQAAILRGLL